MINCELTPNVRTIWERCEGTDCCLFINHKVDFGIGVLGSLKYFLYEPLLTRVVVSSRSIANGQLRLLQLGNSALELGVLQLEKHTLRTQTRPVE